MNDDERYLSAEAVAGWYALAARVVAGITDPTELARWREFGDVLHHARRTAPHGHHRAVELDDLWHGSPKQPPRPVQRRRKNRPVIP